MSDVAIIETKDLTKKYKQQTAVDGLSITVNTGEIFGFLGPNGAGKTTTLLMLLGLTEPTSGWARVFGVDPCRNPIKVKGMIGYLQENMGFYRDLNAWESLKFLGELNRISKKEIQSRSEGALKTVGLIDDAHRLIHEYSRGMRQRLGIAELLMKKPKIAFLDEPTLGLDPDATNQMLDLIHRLSQENNMTVLLSSHLLHHVQKLCNRVGIMIKGKLVALGPLDQLAEDKFGIPEDKLGVEHKTYTLEEIYMKYFQEA